MPGVCVLLLSNPRPHLRFDMRYGITGIIAGLLVTAVLLSMGQTSSTFRKDMQPVYNTTPGYAWTNIGSLTDSNSSPAVTARGYEAMTGLSAPGIIHWVAPADAGIAQFRFETASNNAAAVVEIWCCRNRCLVDARGVNTATLDNYTFGGKLSLTGGQQTGAHENVYVDTISVSDANGVLGSGTVLDSGNDRQAIFEADLKGWKDFIIIGTTLTEKLWADVAWYQ